MSKNSSRRLLETSSRSIARKRALLRMARVNCNMFTFFCLRYYNADIFRFTTAPLMNCIHGIH